MEIEVSVRKERDMTGKSRRRLPGAVAVAAVVAASFASSAGAWIPSVEAGDQLASERANATVAVPDAAERAAKRQAQKNLKAAEAAAPDAFERAVKRYRG